MPEAPDNTQPIFAQWKLENEDDKMKSPLNANRIAFSTLCFLGLAACSPQGELPVASSAPVATAIPPQRSYLDPGPGAPNTGGPNYLRSNVSSAPRQTDFFGNDVLPRNP